MLILCTKFFCGGYILAKMKSRKLEKEREKFSKHIEEHKNKAIECKKIGNTFGYKHYKECLIDSKERFDYINYNLSKCKIKLEKYSLVKTYINNKKSKKYFRKST